MRTARISVAILAAALLPVWSIQGASRNFNLETSDGEGRHMHSAVTITDFGQIDGTTTLKNYRSQDGFAGGVFTVAFNRDGEVICATELEIFPISPAGYGKIKTETFNWSGIIPKRYLSQVHRFAVVQIPNPSCRLWTWIYDNRQELQKGAVVISKLFGNDRPKRGGCTKKTKMLSVLKLVACYSRLSS